MQQQPWHPEQPPSGPPPAPPWPAGQPPVGATGFGGHVLADWWQRVAAFLIDQAIWAVTFMPGFVLVIAHLVGKDCEHKACADEGEWARPGWVLATGIALLVLATAVHVYNHVWQQGSTGQTWGKRVLRIRLVGLATLRPLGRGTALGRYALRGLLILVGQCLPVQLVSWLWPLWDQQRQTWEDKAVHSIVVRA
jgi:uncharacterized RDD family membrane protein YckC